MKSANVMRSALALALASGLLTAQSRDRDQQQPPRDQERNQERDANRQDRDRGQDKDRDLDLNPFDNDDDNDRARKATEIQFGVTGLTQENVERVRRDLTSITGPVYVCPNCKKEYARDGKCEKCQQDLNAEKRPVIQEVNPSVEEQRVRLEVGPGRALRYSELERALLGSSIRIESGKFPLNGNAQLVLRGGQQENVETIEKVLNDSKNFENVDATFDPSMNEIRVTVRAGRQAPTLASVTSTLEGAGVRARLADVVWGQEPQRERKG